MLSQKLPSAFTTGSTRTRLGLLTGYISASVSLGLCFATIRDRVSKQRNVIQTELQSVHAALQKDMDALQGKLDCLKQLSSGVETKDPASVSLCPYWLWLGESSSAGPLPTLSHSHSMSIGYLKAPTSEFDEFVLALSVVVMVILSFKLLTAIFSTFNLGSMSRGVVRRRKYFKL